MAATTDKLNSIRPLTSEPSTGGIHEERLIKRVFLTPAVTILLLMSIFPLLWSLGISFTNIEQGGRQVVTQNFLGLGFDLTLRNYERLLTDQRLFDVARNTLFYVIAGVTVQYTVGFGIALLLNQDFRGRTVFRVIFLLPMMMTPVATAYAGRMMFDSTFSPLAQLIRTIGSVFGDPRLTASWLTEASWAPWTIVLIDSWQWIPFMTLLLLAGLQAIPDEIYEAARVDGATTWSIFWRITFPIMLPISITAILIRSLEIFKIIDIIRITTGGGPGTATESLVMYVFNQALTFGNYSYAAAISYVLLVLVVVFSTVFLAIGRRANRRVNG
ncbi:MAG: ABC transporter permease [Phototrophicales bacterium]|nr:MAG: ABC transporter permease [Phototrophicales bacterium]